MGYGYGIRRADVGWGCIGGGGKGVSGVLTSAKSRAWPETVVWGIMNA